MSESKSKLARQAGFEFYKLLDENMDKVLAYYLHAHENDFIKSINKIYYAKYPHKQNATAETAPDQSGQTIEAVGKKSKSKSENNEQSPRQ